MDTYNQSTSALCLASPEEVAARNERRRMTLDWAVWAFAEPGREDDVSNPQQRALRFLEEAVELAQAIGLSPEMAKHTIDVVYSKPAGDPEQEAGGVMVTLNGLCESKGISLAMAENKEWGRVLGKPREHWRPRWEAKKALGL